MVPINLEPGTEVRVIKIRQSEEVDMTPWNKYIGTIFTIRKIENIGTEHTFYVNENPYKWWSEELEPIIYNDDILKIKQKFIGKTKCH